MRKSSKFIAVAGIVAVSASAALAGTASAAYSPNPNASFSGQAHGTFGAIGAQGDQRHDLGQGDDAAWADGHLGANPATGANNAGVMGEGTPTVHESSTPSTN
jgi:hypothetical protein